MWYFDTNYIKIWCQGNISKDLLEFQNSFQELFDEEELKLMEKRSIETFTEGICSLRFRIL